MDCVFQVLKSVRIWWINDGQCISGAEISEDLVEVLQKKLNDAVLDVITVTLSRNPMCKLSPDDVQVNGLVSVDITSSL